MTMRKKKLNYFKKKLELERQRVLDILSVDDKVKEIRESERQPADEADQALDLANQTFTWSMRKREFLKLREIDEALARIDNGSFGICEETGELIEEKRLEVQPWTRMSLEAAKEIEMERTRQKNLRLAPNGSY